MLEQILAALFVIGLLLATIWLLRRKGFARTTMFGKRAGRSTTLQVLERVHLTAQHSLHVVRLGEELLLIGVSPGSCHRITARNAVTEPFETGIGQ